MSQPLSRLSILAIGTELPPSVDIAQFAASKGARTDFYNSWKRVCHARDENDQPSTLGSAALAKALARSGVEPGSIKLVIFTGVSRDYVPSWSVATEVMKLNGISEDCVGIDITIGCLATLTALDFAMGFLMQRGGGHAAIVAAERWSYTVDHSDPDLAGMWVWADGGAAMVLGLDTGRPSLGDFVGAEFTSRSDYNGHVLIPYGGTRAPIAPAGVNPYARQVSSRPRGEVKQTYARNYRRTFDTLVKRFGVRGERLVCNQISPRTVGMITESLGYTPEQCVITGHDTGHLGAPDIIVGLDTLTRDGPRISPLAFPVTLGASTAYAFGTGLVLPPA